jgi:hypothetical protein
VTELERAAEAWIADHPTSRHLTRTRDWVLKLSPTAGEAIRLAALTHDVERRVPGGPSFEESRGGEDAEYLRAHSERSARMVDEWLEARNAPAHLRERVSALVRAHETGGWPEADLLQAADSLSFLEVNRPRVIGWVTEGRCSVQEARAKLDRMRSRITLPAAQEIANSLHQGAADALEAAFPSADRPPTRG